MCDIISSVDNYTFFVHVFSLKMFGKSMRWSRDRYTQYK